jgi:hypothetical protein
MALAGMLHAHQTTTCPLLHVRPDAVSCIPLSEPCAISRLQSGPGHGNVCIWQFAAWSCEARGLVSGMALGQVSWHSETACRGHSSVLALMRLLFQTVSSIAATVTSLQAPQACHVGRPAGALKKCEAGAAALQQQRQRPRNYALLAASSGSPLTNYTQRSSHRTKAPSTNNL